MIDFWLSKNIADFIYGVVILLSFLVVATLYYFIKYLINKIRRMRGK